MTWWAFLSSFDMAGCVASDDSAVHKVCLDNSDFDGTRLKERPGRGKRLLLEV
jgi:hypothetical protein